MKSDPLVVEQLFDSPIDLVWSALTETDRMQKWYFNISDFKAEAGFEFRFEAGTAEKKYTHVCRITEVIPRRKITYSWRYEGYGGISHVTFELAKVEMKTRVRITHSGLETFPQDLPDFRRENFKEGWTAILGQSLKGYVEARPAGVSRA